MPVALDSLLADLLEDAEKQVGHLMDRRRVADSLLDLRIAGAHDPAFARSVDKLLANLPGTTTVLKDWWIDRLFELRDAARRAAPTP